ncbi:MAG: ABC transporter permease [Candidatus Pseudobacter hemicellulosilyticus]|uniref:ABC transporter permease n=1 Tax=Candidatus Pseudobacter hemicellulosilyticus TaxID=3121375 RepID=A0AAJ5WVW9_9BACT|nr:MAG: ABC transporter permease [Pseudobacter sp.]
MNKTWIVAQREFNSRVRKKTFLLSTILLPVLLFGLYGLMIYFSMKGNDDISIAVTDKAGIFTDSIKSDKDLQFVFLPAETEAGLKEKVDKKEYSGYLFVNEGHRLGKDSLSIRTPRTIGVISREQISNRINTALKEKRLLSFNISRQQLDSAQATIPVSITALSSTAAGSEADDKASIVATAVGFTSGFLIYIVLFIYGTMVMRGVMEEKVSRIAEVIVSSVKPFQLMMGKILGIGAVGLVQFLIWIVLMSVLAALLPSFVPDPQTAMQHMPGAAGAPEMPSGGMAELMSIVGGINFPLIIGCFIFYFLGGYLLYSSLFAAVGSAVNEDPQDAQSLLLPITMPIIFGIMIMVRAVSDPNSPMAVFGSLFPLTSPIVMMARLAHGIPAGVSTWELVLSMGLLVLGFVLTTWVAAKIYRTGILLYGKKVTWKEMWKWAFRKS